MAYALILLHGQEEYFYMMPCPCNEIYDYDYDYDFTGNHETVFRTNKNSSLALKLPNLMFKTLFEIHIRTKYYVSEVTTCKQTHYLVQMCSTVN